MFSNIGIVKAPVLDILPHGCGAGASIRRAYQWYAGATTRGRRRSPFVGYTTADTDKPWKQQSARQVRRATRQVLTTTIDGDAVPDRRGLGDAYGVKDGKQWVSDPRPEDWRK